MYHGDSPIYYTYKFRGVLKIFPSKGLGKHAQGNSILVEGRSRYMGLGFGEQDDVEH